MEIIFGDYHLHVVNNLPIRNEVFFRVALHAQVGLNGQCLNRHIASIEDVKRSYGLAIKQE